MTPVILLTDAFIANGSSAWRIPEMDKYPEIKPNYVANYQDEKVWKAYRRNKGKLGSLLGDSGNGRFRPSSGRSGERLRDECDLYRSG